MPSSRRDLATRTPSAGAIVLALVLAACAVRGRPLDTRALVAKLGVDGAAEALRIRIAEDPADVAARRALAALEEQRGRPGGVLVQLEAVWTIGGPLGARLDDAERATLVALLRQRAAARVRRGSPDALADLDAARAIAGAGGEDAALRREANVLLALADLRSTDPERRAAGARRIGAIKGEPERAAMFAAIADPGHAGVDELGAAGAFLWEHGARRAALDLLDAWERGGGRGRGGPALAATVDDWLAARAWWRGAAGRPDLATLRRAIDAGAWPCRVATAPGEHGCRAVSVLGNPIRERELIARARDRGWRIGDPEEAAAWVALTARAWARGDIPSWLDELDARIDLAALGITPDGEARVARGVPTWARGPLLRAAGRLDDAKLATTRARRAGAGDPKGAEDSADTTDDDGLAVRELVLALERAIADGAERPPSLDPEPSTAGVATAGTTPDSARADAGTAPQSRLDAVVRAYRTAPAAGDRLAEDAAAREIDVAVVGVELAELFLRLGDPARARAWMERAVEASPRDVGVRAGLVRALAAAGDGAAARLHLTTVAAGSGDAAAALLAGARALGDAGLTVDAIAPAKLALELTPAGDQAEMLALLVELEGRLDRPQQVQSLTTALDAARPPRDRTTLRARALAGDADALARAFAADPVDESLALAAAAAEPDDARAVAILTRAAAWNPRSTALAAALQARRR